uniref:Uncharacterized protein n=1 Tax=Heliothis virescens TaxID=7102 RepID=A0A2A4JUR8_HELVI
MAPTTMLPKLSDATQTISFSDGDGVCSAEVYSTNVMVNTNAGNHDHGSSKVKLKNLVDYNWEPKFYAGQLLAIHTNGKYLAYSIKAPNAVNPGTWSGMVRVVYNPEPGTDRRALIKGMKGEVQDLAFAHIQSQVVLACIDEQGNFYVHEIEVTDSGLRCTLLAEVREDTGAVGSSHRVVWCPYIPDDEDEAADDDVARLLLTTHDNIARMWNTRALQSAGVGTGGAVGAAGGGALCAAEHVAAILDAAFSPDGSALATASADGYVMFFQVYMHADSSPRCLHKWQPHGGKPLSCLFFLDNHKNYNTDVQFWKFAVTGAENNTTIKIWSCKSWTCLQTITFTPGVGTDMTLGLKAMLDTSASYLLLSDFKSRSLYVLNMARDPEDSMAYCKSISEFLLPYPVLSFCIVDAEEQQTKCEPSCDEPLYRNGSGGDADSPIHYELHHDDSGSGGSGGEEWRRVVVRLYIVQPKGLQEGRLVYEPPRPPLHAELLHGLSDLVLEDSSVESAPATIASSILQQQSQQLKNLLMRTQVPEATQPGSLIGTRPESPSIAPQLNLMTPDAFSSPGKREEDDPPLSATPDVSSKPRNSTGGPCVEETLGETASKLASAGSSPSREVQQIMSHSDHAFFKEEPEEVTVATETLSTTETLFEADVFAAAEPAPLPPPPPHPPHPHKLASTNSDTWPSISVPQVSEAVPAQQLSQSLGALAGDDSRAGLSAADRTRLDALEHKLDKLTEMLSAQTRELRSLRGAVVSPRDHELASKMAATDQLLRENIDKLATSKTVMERLSTSIAKSLSDMVRESFREALFDSVVPVMEKTHAQIFKQINQAFQNGTKEFAANTEAAARAAAERGGAAATASLRAALERHAEALASAHSAAHHHHLADVIRETTHSSPGKREEDDPPLSATPDVSSKPRNSTGGPCVEETLGETASKLASAGSSPSREVQQIMSHSDHAFFKEEPEEVTVATETLSTTETLFEADVFAAAEPAPLPPPPPHPPHPHKLASTNSDTWPSISVPQVSEAVPAQQLSQSLGALAGDDSRAGLSAADRTRLDALEHKLDKLTEMLSAQTRELRSLRGAVVSPRDHELASKMAATDQLLRENIDKLATSKTVMERLSTSIAKSLSDMVRESFREALFDSVVPVMEKTHAQIFKQINQAFQNGTKEFAANTEAAARAAAERGGAAATASLRAALERHAEALASAHSAAHHHHLADVIRETTHSVLEKELGWWREQARSVALASRAHSPSTPHSHHAADRQMQVAQIQSLIASGDVNGAFQQALSASDLALVMCACRAAEPAHVFGPPCKLKQHVLLSLVQQLAADMARDTPLKHRYLEEAVMNLDTSNPVTTGAPSRSGARAPEAADGVPVGDAQPRAGAAAAHAASWPPRRWSRRPPDPAAPAPGACHTSQTTGQDCVNKWTVSVEVIV